jgi:SAM-dependent methyltransferase
MAQLPTEREAISGGEAMRYLNLGCGKRYHSSWINIDIAPQGPEISAYDLSKGIPLPEGSCDVVYHSNLLEHLRRPHARRLIEECFRVLKPGGTLRVAVPDLEQICRVYLTKLESALSGDIAGFADYEWMVIELLDQMVREQSGGDMLTYLNRDFLPNEVFVYTRIGEEGRDLVLSLHRPSSRTQGAFSIRSLWHRGRRVLSRSAPALCRALTRCILLPFLGRTGLHALQIGRFRQSGEIHHWMYDRYSLRQLMVEAGFSSPAVVTAGESRIPGWPTYNLDTLSDGTVVKPDSLFMESTKPERTQQDGKIAAIP